MQGILIQGKKVGTGESVGGGPSWCPAIVENRGADLFIFPHLIPRFVRKSRRDVGPCAAIYRIAAHHGFLMLPK